MKIGYVCGTATRRVRGGVASQVGGLACSSAPWCKETRSAHIDNRLGSHIRHARRWEGGGDEIEMRAVSTSRAHQPREHTARERLMLMPVVRARGDALLGSGLMPSGLPSSIVSLDLRSWSLAECTAAMSSVRELPPSEPESSWVSLLSR